MICYVNDLFPSSPPPSFSVQHYKMNMRQVFCETARGLAIKHRHGEVRRLLQCIQQQCQSKSVNMDAMNDDIVMAAVEELAKQTRDIRDHVRWLTGVVGGVI